MLDGRGNIDEGMIQNSWIEMKTILDKEMPVVKKGKRRFIWIFIFMLLGFSIGALMVNFIFQKENQIKSNHTEIVNESESLTPKEENKDGIQKIVVDDKNLIVKSEESSLSTSFVEIQDDKINSKGVSKVVLSNNNDLNLSTQKISNDGEIATSTAVTDDFELNTLIDKTANPSEISSTSVEKRSFLKFPFINKKAPKISYKPSFVLEDKVVIQPISNSNWNSFLGYLDTRIIEYQNFNFEAGMGYEFKLTKGFMLFANIGYGIDSYTEEVLSGSTFTERIIANSVLETNFNASLSSVDLEKGNYFGLKGGFKIPVKGRVNIMSGIQYRIYTNNNGNDNFDLSAADDMTAPVQEQDMDPYQVSFVNRNDLFFKIGLEFQLNNRSFLNASLLQQFNDPYKVSIVNYNLEQGQSFFRKRKEVRIGLTYKL